MKSLEGGVMKRSGAYVMFVRAKRSNAIHLKRLKRLRNISSSHKSGIRGCVRWEENVSMN